MEREGKGREKKRKGEMKWRKNGKRVKRGQ